MRLRVLAHKHAVSAHYTAVALWEGKKTAEWVRNEKTQPNTHQHIDQHTLHEAARLWIDYTWDSVAHCAGCIIHLSTI